MQTASDTISLVFVSFSCKDVDIDKCQAQDIEPDYAHINQGGPDGISASVKE